MLYNVRAGQALPTETERRHKKCGFLLSLEKRLFDMDSSNFAVVVVAAR